MYLATEFSLGELAYDDLTRTHVKVVGIKVGIGRCGQDRYPDDTVIVGYWVDHDWLGGARNPWELTKLESERERDDV